MTQIKKFFFASLLGIKKPAGKIGRLSIAFHYFITKIKEKTMSAAYLTGIFFDANGKGFKYRNIKNSEFHKTKFELFAKSKGANGYVNYYNKDTKKFTEKRKFAI